MTDRDIKMGLYDLEERGRTSSEAKMPSALTGSACSRREGGESPTVRNEISTRDYKLPTRLVTGHILLSLHCHHERREQLLGCVSRMER